MSSKIGGFGATALAATAVISQWGLCQASEVADTNVSSSGTHCQDGLVIPMWLPINNLTAGDRLARGIVYFFGLLYLFIGVSIISDRFMAAIEVITSSEKEVKVHRPNGETQIVVVRVWNETVANLTLMALGSSAPEILLSIIEIIAKNFNAGDLGPGTIVGSAAYNLFVIIAICVLVIPNGEVRKIKHLRVFFVTATWSIFAYVWLYLILAVISPGVVEVWEGFLTFMFFPTTVLTAYIADRRLLIYKYLNKDYRMNKRGVIVQAEGTGGADLELASKEEPVYEEGADELEEARREYIETLRELRKKYPQSDLREIEVMAHEAILNKSAKSRAFYRVQATRKMMGSGNVMKKIQERAQSDLSEVRAELQRGGPAIEKPELDACAVCFDPGAYTVMENCGEFEVTVVRKGDPEPAFTVKYCTEDGSAEAGSDYYEASGVLEFASGEMKKSFFVRVIDDDVFEQDEHFYVRLSEPQEPVTLATPRVATVVILDDDHSGIFSFAAKDHDLVESVGTYELKVVRQSGARGRVIVPYWTEGGTAKEGKDYEAARGELVFENNETEKIIPIYITEEDSYEKDVLFYAHLGEPKVYGGERKDKGDQPGQQTQLVQGSNGSALVGNGDMGWFDRLQANFSAKNYEVASAIAAAEAKAPEDLTEEDKITLMGRPKQGDIVRAQLRIKESKEFKNTVDKLVQRANASILIGSSSWREQFSEALTVSAGDDDNGNGEGDEDDEKHPSCSDYLMHYLTVFWKLLFACVPPTDIAGGYVCFVVSILAIGVVTAVIGDVASHFGCTLGIQDSVTAIVFVALGTSIPDTFASKVAAIQDKYADASVGNVTGSNAVNVFLGIGIAWSIAAVYHACKGRAFEVDPGNLAFSVTLFCTEAVIAIMILLMRRSRAVGGVLGGPKVIKYVTASFMFGLWVFYLVMSSLEVYDVIEGF